MLDVMRSSGPSGKGVYNQLHANAPIQPLNCDNLPVTSAHRLCAYRCRPTEQPAKPVPCYYATTRPAFASCPAPLSFHLLTLLRVNLERETQRSQICQNERGSTHKKPTPMLQSLLLPNGRELPPCKHELASTDWWNEGDFIPILQGLHTVLLYIFLVEC